MCCNEDGTYDLISNYSYHHIIIHYIHSLPTQLLLTLIWLEVVCTFNAPLRVCVIKCHKMTIKEPCFRISVDLGISNRTTGEVVAW